MKIHFAISLIITLLGALLLPIFCQYYEQKTGIYPLVFVIFSGAVTFFNWAYIIIPLVEGKK
jgi:hypothetical protein